MKKIYYNTTIYIIGINIKATKARKIYMTV